MASSSKVLSVGLGDLVSARNAALRSAGFEVVAALSFDEVVQECVPVRFDVAIVGHSFSIVEKSQFVRCIQRVFGLPVILITKGDFLASIRADLHIGVDAPSEELICAIHRLLENRGPTAIAV